MTEELTLEEKYNNLQKRFESVSNQLLSLQLLITSIIGTYKFFFDTTKLETPFTYKVVENEELMKSYNAFNGKE